MTSGITSCMTVWIAVPLPEIGNSGRKPSLSENLMDLTLEK